MGHNTVNGLDPFPLDDPDSWAPAWVSYKRSFDIELASAGLDDKPGKRKVNNLIKCMGKDCIDIYDGFEWEPARVAVEADVGNGIAAVAARPAEDKNDLAVVKKKFDIYFGVQRYRARKRQEFLDTQRKKDSNGKLENIMRFVTDLKKKAEFCDYGDMKEEFIVDKLINGCKDSELSKTLISLPDDDLTLPKAISVCRQHEMTSSHVKKIEEEERTTQKEVHAAHRGRGRGRGQGQRRGQGQGRGAQGGSSGARGSYQGHMQYCDRCCKHHEDRNCPAFNKNCDNCGQKGHYKYSPRCERNSGNSRGRGRGYSGGNRGGHYSNNRPQQEQYSPRTRGGYGYGRGRGHYGDQGGHGVHYADDSYDYSETVHYANDSYDYRDAEETFGRLNMNDVFTLHVDNTNAIETVDLSTNTLDVHVANDDWSVRFHVQGRPLDMEIDTGARCNVIDKATLIDLNVNHVLNPSSTVINGVHGKCVRSLGIATLPCRYKDKLMNVDFEVLDNVKRLNLLGRCDSKRFGLIARVNTVDCDIAHEYRDVIGDEIGCMPGEYDIKIDREVMPVTLNQARPVPAPIREQVKKELDNLVRCGVLVEVTEPTDWVSAMVCVRKKNGRVRICIDPTDLNKAILREHYPMNNLEDIATRLNGSKIFSTLDANMGYYQFKLSSRSSYLTTFITPFGRFRYVRVPMGIHSASEVFQREMINHFGNMDGVEIVMDDILIHGKDVKEHNERLRKVLDKAREINLKMNKAKCKIAVSEVDYVGHKITGEGLKPTEDRVKSIKELKAPKDVTELETILGMMAYVAKFIPNLSDINAPLRELKKEKDWKWTRTHQDAFDRVKKILTSQPVLKFYDVNKPVTLTVDASNKGLGAAILQSNGVVAYASRALTPTEQRYAQIEKEMLSVVFGCTKFHKLIYGKNDITIENDHKPLESLLKKQMHMSPMRIERMRLKLQPYNFKLIHVKGKLLGLADCLSRFPQEMRKDDTVMEEDLMVCTVDTVAFNSHEKLEAHTK